MACWLCTWLYVTMQGPACLVCLLQVGTESACTAAATCGGHLQTGTAGVTENHCFEGIVCIIRIISRRLER